MIKNLTPHAIDIVGEDNEVILTLSPEGVAPRLYQSTKQVDVVDGVSITETVFGDTQDLPDAQEGVLLIVSRLVMTANPHRKDLLVPNELVRDDKGNIIGAKSLSRN